MFSLQQAAVAWYSGRGPIRDLVSYGIGVGLLVTLYQVIIAFSPLSLHLFRDLLGAEERLARMAGEALKVSVFFAPFLAVRSVLQGILISRRRAGPIWIGTFLRLSTLTWAALWWAPGSGLSGPVAGVCCLLIGVLVETTYVAIAVPSTNERSSVATAAHVAGREWRSRTRFLIPLVGMVVLGTLTNPVINAFIARTPEPEVGLAAYAVIASLVWFLASPFLRFSSVTIAMGETPEALRRLHRFLWSIVLPLCVILALLHLTPLWDHLLHGLLGLTDDLAHRVTPPLVFLSFQPLVAALLSYNQGCLTRSAHTWRVGLGGVGRVTAILAAGFAGIALAVPGPILGGVLLGLSFLAELAILLLLKSMLARQESAPRPA